MIVSCGEAGQITARVNGSSTLKPGDAVGLAFEVENVHAFGADGLALSKAG